MGLLVFPQFDNKPSAVSLLAGVPNVGPRSVRMLSVCAGVGGLDLGVGLAVSDARTVCFVEREGYCCEVLVERMEDGSLDEAPVWSDLRTFDGRQWRGIVDCVIGGYPCQPFSVAGRRGGDRDSRHLWPEVARIVREIEPAWCFFENVSGHLRLGFESVYADLRALGFVVAAGLFSSRWVGASHKRERLFILGHRLADTRHLQPEVEKGTHRQHEQRSPEWRGQQQPSGFGAGGRTLPRSPAQRVARNTAAAEDQDCSQPGVPPFPPAPDLHDTWDNVLRLSPGSEPCVRGMVDGMATRLDRLRACGNGVVPAVASLAWKTLMTALVEAGV